MKSNRNNRNNNKSSNTTTNPSTDNAGDVLSGAENAENSNNNSNFNGDTLLKTIASRQSQALLPSSSGINNTPLVTLTIYIPTSSVGAVIGRRGQNIANVQKAAAAYASTNHPVRVSIVSQDGNSHNPAEHSNQSVPYTYSELDWSDAAWTPVVIRADPCAALTAAAKLEAIAGGKQNVDEVVLDVPLSRTKHAALVGKRGQTLGALSADTNVRIMVPAKELRHDMVQLEGQLANVKQCLANILQIVAKQTSATVSSQTKSSDAAAPAGSSKKASTEKSSAAEDAATVVQQTVPVLPNGAMPSQTKLRTIGRKTDCTIKKKKMMLRSGDTSQQKWHLIVTGSSNEQVQAAVAILQKWNEDNKDGAASAASGGGGQQQQPSSPNNRRGRGRRPNANNAKSPKRGGGGGGGGKSKQQQQQQQQQAQSSSNAATATATSPTSGGESTA